MTRLILIRHGETDWNIEGRYQGQADPPLNATGRAQAQAVTGSLRTTGLDLIYTSPLQRACQTAEIIGRELHVPVHADPRLMEIEQGAWEEMVVTDIEREYPELLRRWRTEPWSANPPGGESLQEVQARVHAALDDIVRRHPDRCVGMVTHRIPFVLVKLRYQPFDPNTVRTLAMDLPNTYWEEILISDEREG